MILNIDSRTDIPAFYSEWILNRFDEGFLYVRDPENLERIYKVILDKKHIEGIVWKSKNYGPILKNLEKITKDFPSIFYYTINDYGNNIEPDLSLKDNIVNFIKLSQKYGKDKIIWRYDPILITDKYSLLSHSKKFSNLCEKLHRYTNKVIINFIDINDSIKERIPEIKELSNKDKIQLIGLLVRCANQYGLQIQFCNNGNHFKDLENIETNACFDKCALNAIGINNNGKPKPNEFGCLCYPKTSIGEFNTCLHKCKYCNICLDFDKCEENYRKHDPKSPLLVGWPIGNEEIITLKPSILHEKPNDNVEDKTE